MKYDYDSNTCLKLNDLSTVPSVAETERETNAEFNFRRLPLPPSPFHSSASVFALYLPPSSLAHNKRDEKKAAFSFTATKEDTDKKRGDANITKEDSSASFMDFLDKR